MYPVSDDFLAAVLAGNQLVVVRSELYLDDAYVCDLPLDSGAVTADGTRTAMRDCSLTLALAGADDPAALWAALATPGIEAKLWRGLTLPDGTDELVPLGVFLLSDPERNRVTGEATVSGTDRSLRVSRNRWLDPYTIAAATDLGTALIDLLESRWAAIMFGPEFALITNTVAAKVVLGAGDTTDPWSDAHGIANDHGFDLYFDAQGTCRLRAFSDPSVIDATYNEGEQGVIVEQTDKVSLEGVYSGVIATGEGTGLAAPVRGEAWDTNPLSPTYVGGPFGYVPMFYSSPLLTTTAQAQAAAATLLAKRVGAAASAVWSQAVNPALEPFDVVELTHEDGTASTFALDTLTIPVAPGDVMTAAGRVISVVS